MKRFRPNRIPAGCLAVLTALLPLAPCGAELSVPAIFSDGMVLQQKARVPVWGTAEAGARVEVAFQEQRREVRADAEGRWKIHLDPLSASATPATLEIRDEERTLTIQNVLVGEVWLCGGQSNMDFTLAWFSKKARDPKFEPIAEYLRNEVASANDPLFRHFKVARAVSAFEEQSSAQGVWQSAVPGQAGDFTATGYFFGRELRKELGVPVALLSCNWGGTRLEAWMPMSAFQQNESLKKYYDDELGALKKKLDSWDEAKVKANYDKQLTAWTARVEEAKARGARSPRRPPMPEKPELNKHLPSGLYNGMMHSLVPYAVKGVIWYQGESNVDHFPEEYGMRFAAMIDAWRANWTQDHFYFYWCQLANFKPANAQPVADDDKWAVVRDQQRLTLDLPDTGMAVLSDIGQADDIHPKNKVDAGKRLALWALKQAYGKDLVCSGPLYKSSRVEGNKLVITFDQVGSGLMVGKKHLMDPTVEVAEPLKQFQICGADQQWKWADAKITGRDTVEVWHPEIAEPVEVRYAWAQNPEGANLYNREGLPASVFSTGSELEPRGPTSP